MAFRATMLRLESQLHRKDERQMATDRRMARVSEQIRREVSQMLVNGIKDDRIGTGIVSVTDVDVSGDLQHAQNFCQHLWVSRG